ncbi:hypothetical protein LJC36_01710 [Desulfovibrio sp. OttesenSCG-928-C14]|nr:hypothetical protein [Desulfovibrio sp. OttesenSCG-928-C14]
MNFCKITTHLVKFRKFLTNLGALRNVIVVIIAIWVLWGVGGSGTKQLSLFSSTYMEKIYSVIGVLFTGLAFGVVAYNIYISTQDKKYDNFANIFWEMMRHVFSLKNEPVGYYKDSDVPYYRNVAVITVSNDLITKCQNCLNKRFNIEEALNVMKDDISNAIHDHFITTYLSSIFLLTAHVENYAPKDEDKIRYNQIIRESLSFEEICLLFFVSHNVVKEEYVEQIKSADLLKNFNIEMIKRFKRDYFLKPKTLSDR